MFKHCLAISESSLRRFAPRTHRDDYPWAHQGFFVLRERWVNEEMATSQLKIFLLKNSVEVGFRRDISFPVRYNPVAHMDDLSAREDEMPPRRVASIA